ncbi:uncharacterized protein HD556DRAFT_1444933 [Suillus plorans]|uniref:Uncharacterized protein n=1 Tax=Suillus plorans TaxID=116603 RepID=A0A9P7DFY4_9AGAM|nr:uncharacterized protein HD556DRAFT_1444933 [Suillus plorans]KAG1791857.1 hypothetical protein HD556DRAFT_1444933 [Suillus plorans]
MSNIEIMTRLNTFHEEMMGEINQLKASFAQQDKKIQSLDERIQSQDRKIQSLDKKIRGLEDSTAKLSASSKEMAATLQRHSKVLHALHRRAVLDDAHARLCSHYGYNIQFRPGSQEAGECGEWDSLE